MKFKVVISIVGIAALGAIAFLFFKRRSMQATVLRTDQRIPQPGDIDFVGPLPQGFTGPIAVKPGAGVPELSKG